MVQQTVTGTIEKNAAAGSAVDLRRLTLALLLGAVLPLLDATIVNVALDRLAMSFSVSLSTVQWVVTGYAMAAAIAIPLTGWAVGRFGAKQVWITALSLFLTGSVLCGLAWSAWSLIAFRVIQGVGAGMSMPVLQTILMRAVGPERARQAMASIGVPAVVAPVLGPLVGGLILAHLSWRWVFYVNLPVCVAALALAARIPADRPDRSKSLDLRGLVLLPPALALLVYGLSEVGGAGGTAGRAVASLALGAVLVIAFVVHAGRRPTGALVDVRLFTRPSFSGAAALMILAGLYFYGALVLLPLYYLQVMSYSTLATGAVLGLQGVGAYAARSASGWLTNVLGVRAVVMGGLALTAAGTLPFCLGDGPANPYLLGASLLVRGAGVGVVTVLILAAAYQGLDRDRIPDASSASRILLQLGGALGVALITAVLQWRVRVDNGGLQWAFHETFWWLTGSVLLGLVPALLLTGKSRQETQGAAR
jgi:EmrB/QacA subfamily drug resistance transporter